MKWDRWDWLHAALLTIFVILAVLTIGLQLFMTIEGRPCLRSHLQPLVAGKVITMMWICDQWEDKP